MSPTPSPLSSALLSAAAAAAPVCSDPRPRLALVLGSGGVRSAAAIGIAEVLAAEGLRPDLIVGCSSGALFGATLALQLAPDEALRLAQTLWTADLTARRRWWAYVQLALPRWAGFGPEFGLRDSSGIAERIGQAFGEQAVEHLPTPLRVVATDAASGARVVLTQGPLVASLCASMAVPFLFAPVRLGGRLLVDGVISDPLPVSAAADVDLVLSLGFVGDMPRRVDRPSRLFGRASTAVINNLMQARLDAARASGQMVLPIEVQFDRRVGLWETAAIGLAQRAGQQAMLAALPELRRLLRSSEARRRALAGVTRAGDGRSFDA